MKNIPIIFLVTFLFFSCSENTKNGKVIKSNNQEIKDSIGSVQKGTELQVAKTSYTQIGNIQDYSYSNVKRYSVDILIPTGRNKKDVIATFKKATKEIGEKINFDALAVYAYTRYDNSQENLPIGYAIYAPDGKWENASISNPKLIKIHLGNAYFKKDRTDLPEINEIAYLKSKDGEKIPISRERDSWEDEDIIKYFPAGTKVKILDKYYWGTKDYEFIRYYISIKNLKGWVHSWDLSINKN